MDVHGFLENGWIDATIDGVRQQVPDDPENTDRQRIAAWEGEGNVIAPYVPLPATQEQLDSLAKIAAQEALTTILAASVIVDEALPEEQKRKVAPLFPRWVVGEAVAIGDMRRHEEGLYRCVQAHTTQVGWEPQNTPALWNAVFEGAPGEIPPWQQPVGTHDAYQIGDRVTHNGSTWISTHANNIWTPGVFGWIEE